MDIEPSDLFAALAHPLRLRCLLLLLREEELCVCELTHATGAAQPSVSRHLGQMRQLGLVSDRREGLWIYYRLHPALPQWSLAVLQEITRGLASTSPFSLDSANLAKMPNRPGVPRCA